VGARGLRIILEELMLDIMYEAPSLDNVKEIIINEKDVQDKKIHLASMKKAV
jgi:ATP-dependent Clp protease ATP-binding subunit ClpX